MADPTPPFGASVSGVQDLLPEARILEQLPPGPPGVARGITRGQVEGWLEELTGVLELRLDGWRRLRDTPTAEEIADEVDAPRVRLARFARTALHNGAASYVEAARFPERAAKADTSYAEVLWQRWQGLADTAATWLELELARDDQGDDGSVEAGPGAGGIVGSFPPATFTVDRMAW